MVIAENEILPTPIKFSPISIPENHAVSNHFSLLKRNKFLCTLRVVDYVHAAPVSQGKAARVRE